MIRARSAAGRTSVVLAALIVALSVTTSVSADAAHPVRGLAGRGPGTTRESSAVLGAWPHLVKHAPARLDPSFAAGSLIIPMDTSTSGNHASYNQNQGMWRAYGLVYRLLQNGIPVNWAIAYPKTDPSATDVSVQSVSDLRTGTALGSWDYAGGPFIIDHAYAAEAAPLIRAWWAANANQPNVHVAQTDFDATVNVTLRQPPLIAEDAVNANIAIGYFNAAGIPDAAGKPWTTSSSNVLSQAQIADGALYGTRVGGCGQRKYDIFVTPHNGGFSYSLSDPTNLGTRAYAQLDNFVHDGGGWTALCHSILSNENAIADLTLHGSPAVRALFDTTLAGGQPGGFLTKTGFPKIVNTGGTWAVHSDAAGLPIAQLVGTNAAQALPGGSVQTWPAPGNAGAPDYWDTTERVASFTTAAGVQYDHIIAGTYHDGTGAGKLVFIGGHQLSTNLPYSGNNQGPYLRVFYNSLFFNGAAVAKLDLTTSPDVFPQHGDGTLNVSITNTGGSVATNARNVGITLQPGFSYVRTISGPQPDTVDGQHLVWNSLGDVAGGASAVTIAVSVDSAASGTVGLKQVAAFSSQYGDVFNESFTTNICHDITISPVPAPTLTKTTDTEGPVVTGASVNWTLSYGNTGAAALQGAVLQDTLPRGFSYVSSTSSPDLGAPTVIPAASGTIVRWTIGTLAADRPNAGTVTITARAGAVTDGTGEPPQQTFTNTSTLSGTDASGTGYSAAASADIDVRALSLSLDKAVDKTSLTSLPGSLTYTLTPESSGNDQLHDVRVIDPYPAGLTAPPDSISAGGTFGGYTPIDGVPGHDDGPPVLDSSFTVSPNVVTQGAPDSVTVTLHLTSSVQIAGVSPGDLGISGGTADCTGPSPAIAPVPAGGTGTAFSWSCTLNDPGEYVFSGSAGDSAGNYAWPTATSPSVLSVASGGLPATGGGSNVITWNLGSTTAPVPGEHLTSGTTSGIFGLRGAGKKDFQRFDTTSLAWAAMAPTPANVNPGGALTYARINGVDTIWALSGDGKQAFWAYDVAANTWTVKASTGTNVKNGGALQYLNVGGHDYVFALMGNGTTTFKRYDVAANTWTTMAVTPGQVAEGGALTTDGTFIYALEGNKGGGLGFWRYDPATNTWTTLANTPAVVKWGGALQYLNVGGHSYVYALEGNGKNVFWRYDIPTNTWSTLANTPANVNNGGALTTDGTNLFAFQGGSKQFWQYTVATNTWSRLADFPPGNTGQGGALVYVPGNHPEGYFTGLEASRSLAITGDQVTITHTIRSTSPVTGVTAGTLTTQATGGASCSHLSGPMLTSADDSIGGIDDPVTYEWTCTVAAGSQPGTLTFVVNGAIGTGGSSGGQVSFPSATSNGFIVTPPLTFTATVPPGAEADSPIVDQAQLVASGQTVNSPPVSTFIGSPRLVLTKTNSPSSDTPLVPGDPITYTIRVENAGVADATGVVITDPVPDHTTYTDCAGGTSCSESGGVVSWQVGTLAPGDVATVSFRVAAGTDVPISGTPYTITNAASATSVQTPEPTHSNPVTNILHVTPTIIKSVSQTEAAPGATLTYTLSVGNPGAPFEANVTDPVPAGTTFAGNCDPDNCTHENGTVSWTGLTLPSGTSTFSFDVTVVAGGGTSIINSANLQTTSPGIGEIPSNDVQTDIGPSLAVAKFNDPTGTVSQGDSITYTLLVTNESGVTAHDVTMTDPLPTGTDFGTCTTPDGTTCANEHGVVTWNLGDVPGGTSISVSFTVTVGTPPVGTIEIGNTAQVSASNTSETATSNRVANPLGDFPELALIKHANETSYDAVGQVIHYSYLVTNNSATQTLAGPVTVQDDKVASVTCPSGGLAPLASMTCTGSATVTQEDLDRGSIVNTATAHANGVDSNPSQVSVPADPHPSLKLEKSITDGAPFTAAGQTISYNYVVTNTGNVTLDSIGVRDDNVDAPAECPDDPLAPGDSLTCTAEHTVTQADVDNGKIVNTATAFSGQVDSNTDSATADANPTHTVKITKTSNATSDTRVGDTITYSFLVENTGTVTIDSFAVTDPLVGLSEIDCHAVTTLAPGDRTTCTATYTVTQADGDAGRIDNTATVESTTTHAGTATDSSSVSTPLTQTPKVTLVKTSNATEETGLADQITYSYLVTNAGTVTLTSFAVTDPMSGLSTINCHGVTALAPGAQTTCTATYTVTQADIDRGAITNTGTVRATTATGSEVTAEDELTTHLKQAPALTLAKAGTLDLVGPANVGDTIGYTLRATNTGNTTLHGVAIMDFMLGPLGCTTAQPVTLAPGEHLDCVGSYTLTQADIDNGQVVNVASVANGDGTTGATAESTVPVPQNPALTLVKESTLDTTVVAPTNRADAGDVVHYKLTASNAGNTTLHNVRISDPLLPDLSCETQQPATLSPGESLVCTGSHTLTQADIDNGQVVNTATAESDQTQPVGETNRVGLSPDPALTLQKTGRLDMSIVPPDDQANVGDVIHYTLRATNTGNTTLTGVAITDPKLGTLTCDQPVTLAPSEHLDCTGTYTLTLADIDSGSVSNTASVANGDGTTTAEGPSQVDLPRSPGLTLSKDGDVVTDVVSPAGRVDAGDRVDYTLRATNTGNTTLTGVRISDPLLPDLSCTPDQPATLRPGESLTCTASHTLTQAEVDAGNIANTATANSDQNTPATADATVDLPAQPDMGLVKTGTLDTTVVAPNDRADVGDRVDFTLRATNTGNVTLHDVRISDSLLSDLSCTPDQPTTLAPGESLVCTGRHTLTLGDIDAGEVRNAAVAHSAETPDRQAESVVTIDRQPGLSLVKDAQLDQSVVPPNDQPNVGDQVHYTLTATNSGNTTLHDVRMSDSLLPNLSCTPDQPATLAPGAHLVCTGTHTLTLADIDAGQVQNTATAHSTEASSPPASETVTLPQHHQLTLTKAGTLHIAAADGLARPGDTISYTLTASNPGNTTLTGVRISDPVLPDLSCTPDQPATLRPGESLTCTGSHTLIQAEVDAGNIANTATANSDQNTPTEADETITIPTQPDLALVKHGELIMSVVPPDTRADAGDVVNYQLTASNTGNVTLHDVTISDPSLPNLSCTPAQPATLAPGDDLECSGSYTLTQADIDAGSVANTATADSEETPTPTTTDNELSLTRVRTLTLVKSGTLDETVAPPDNQANAGDRVDYTVTTTNTGNTTLHNVRVTDPLLTDLTCAPQPPATLVPGEEIVCTGTHTLTQGDIDAGQVTNTATATADDTPEATGSSRVDLPGAPVLTLTKRGTVDQTVVGPPDRVDAGDEVNYTLTATNLGNTTLGQVELSDPLLPDLSCTPAQPATLAPGEALTCTGTHRLTQEEVDAGEVGNVATVKSDQTEPMSTPETVELPAVHSLTLAKDGNLVSSVVKPDGTANAGDRVDYTLTATNTGNTTLHQVAISDPSLPGLSCTPAQPATLAPGEALTCTGSHTLTQGDIDSGQVRNTATVESDQTKPTDAEETVDLPPEPALALVKQGTLRTDIVAPDGRADVGDRIDYTLTTTNAGNTTLHHVAITDPSLPDLSCTPAQPATLAPGEALTCTGSHTLTQADIDSGLVENHAHADSTETGPQPPVSDPVEVPRAPDLSLSKQGTLRTDIVTPDGRADAGDRIDYTLTATNTGNTTLHQVAISDPSLPGLSCTPAQPATLAPGEALTCTGSHTLTQGDIDSGQVRNTATVESDQTKPTDMEETVDLPPEPALALVKQGTLRTDIVAPDGVPDAGDRIDYTLTATNTGNTTLHQVRISDPSLPDLSCTPDQPAALAPGEALTCTGSHTLTQADIDAEKVTNTATAESDQTKPTEDQETVGLPKRLGLTLIKQGTLRTDIVAPDGRADAGDRVDYTLTATNTGNTTLRQVTITDPTLGTLSCTPSQPATVAPGQALTCTGSHTLTQAEIDSGLVENSAHADSTQTGPQPPVSDPIKLPPEPELSLVKQGMLRTDIVAPDGRPDVGDRIDYTLTATNTGNTTLHQVAITDQTLGTLSCTPSQPATLAPGEALTCTGSHTLTQADIDSGLVKNSAHAESTETGPQPPVSDPVELPQASDLSLTKQGTLRTDIVAPDGRADVGDRVDYTLTATNTGNTTLHQVSISDPSLPDLACTPDQPATLAPGEALRCTGSHTLTQGDIDSGQVKNSATADSNETPETPPAEAVVTLEGKPGLSLAKDGVLDMTVVAPADRADAGDVIHYTLTATNTGNTTLHQVAITDPKLGALACTPAEPATLAPNETLQCTGSHTLTQADIDAGQVENTATAESTVTTSPPENETVTLPGAPGLTLDKTGTLDMTVVPPNERADVGDKINFVLRATNVGNTTLHNVMIHDPLLAALTCTQPVTLRPSETLECTGAHTLTAEDLLAGRFNNTATAGSDQTPPTDAFESIVIPGAPPEELSLTKSVDPTSFDRVGQVLRYRYVVTNAGGVSLAAPVTIQDDRAVVSCPLPTSTHNGDGRLGVGEQLICEATHVVTQADLDAGHVINTAIATADGVISNPSSATSGAVQVRSLSLVKSATPTSYTADRRQISYRYVVTNTGNVTLAGPVTVDDNRTHVSCPSGNLAPGASMTCTANYTITDADLQAHSVTNVATAHANGINSNRASATVTNATRPEPPIPPPTRPGIALAKTPASQEVTAGARATFTIRVTNTGTATLSPVTVTDSQVPACSRTSAQVPALGALAPGESVTYTCSVANVGTGFVNTATATGTASDGRRVTSRSSAVVRVTVPPPQRERPSVVLVTSPGRQTVVHGGRARFVQTVRNTGNVILRNVRITDPSAPDCERVFAALAPGESRTWGCSRPGVFASFRKNATVRATSPAGTIVSSSTSVHVNHVTPGARQRPAIMVLKDPDHQRVGRGRAATFQITVRNQGNVRLHSVRVTDPRTPGCSRFILVIPVDRSISYTCTSGPVADSFVNTVTVAGVSPNGTTVTESDFAVVTANGPLLSLPPPTAPLAPLLPIGPPLTG